jgi:hypothetical protein
MLTDPLRSIRLLPKIAAAVTLALAASPSARAECRAIAAVPFVITEPGSYCLAEDVGTTMTSGAAITIEANSVVLDLQDHRLGNLGAGSATTAVGVLVRSAGPSLASNVVVRNGTIRGFQTAVYAQARFLTVEDLRIDSPWRKGIELWGGVSASIRRCQISLAEVAPAPPFEAVERAGIRLAYTDSVIVAGNEVVLATGGRNAGIQLWEASITIVEGNRILLAGNQTDSGIELYLGGTNQVVGNRITGYGAFGIVGYTPSPQHGPVGFDYGDNVVTGARVHYEAGWGSQDIGNNR